MNVVRVLCFLFVVVALRYVAVAVRAGSWSRSVARALPYPLGLAEAEQTDASFLHYELEKKRRSVKGGFNWHQKFSDRKASSRAGQPRPEVLLEEGEGGERGVEEAAVASAVAVANAETTAIKTETDVEAKGGNVSKDSVRHGGVIIGDVGSNDGNGFGDNDSGGGSGGKRLTLAPTNPLLGVPAEKLLSGATFSQSQQTTDREQRKMKRKTQLANALAGAGADAGAAKVGM